MTTWSALTTLASEADAYALSAMLENLDPAPTGVGTFEIEDGSGLWEVGAYFLERPNEVALTILAEAYGARPFAVSKVEDRDWVAQVRRELTPVEAGRFVVYGAHDRDKIAVNRLGLEIEAAMAFGTGHHGTTRGCLLAIDGLARRGFRPRQVADVGCGTGVLAMGAARRWRVQAVATDIDPVAAATARANAKHNRLNGFVLTGTAPGFRHPFMRAARPFDLALANILANPLKRLAPQMRLHVRKGGIIALSGLLLRQANEVEAIYRSFGFRRLRRIPLGEWMTLVLRR